MMFRFVVKRLGFLKSIPLAPHLFDSLLRIHLFFFHAARLKCLDTIEHEVTTWPGITLSLHKYGGIQFNVNNQEIGHLHGNGLLDVLLSRSLKTALMKDTAIQDHHVFKDSGWVSFRIKTPADQQTALAILGQSYLLHLPH